MGISTTVKRRLIFKVLPFVKRFVFPVAVFFLVLQMVFGPWQSTSSEEMDMDMLMPGDALDPFIDSNIEIAKRSRQKESSKVKFVPSGEKSLNSIDKPSPTDEETLREIVEKKDINKLLKDHVSPDFPPADNAHNLDNDDDVNSRMETSWSMAKANVPGHEKVRFKPHAITNDTVTLTLMSSEDKVYVSINKKEIYRSIGQRGLHVIVLNQYSARVMATRVFDTFLEGAEDDLLVFLDDVSDGRIIVFAVLDEIATSLTWKGRNRLQEMGSKFAGKIALRDMWAMVTRQGDLKMAESFSNVATADTGYEWGGPLFMRTDFDLEEKPVECTWPPSHNSELRKKFCLRFEGYGSLCRCDVKYFEDIFLEKHRKTDSQLKNGPLYKDLSVAILATNRTHNLYRLMKSLFEAPGLNSDLLSVYTEYPSRELIALVKLFGVKLVNLTASDQLTPQQRIRSKVGKIFTDVLDVQWPNQEFARNQMESKKTGNVLLLEEDMIASVDIFKYLHALHPVMSKDPSILAISAFNYHGNREVADDETSSRRSTDPITIGLLLTKETVEKYIIPNWPKDETTGTTQEWFRGLASALTGHNAIVYPEVSRLRHASYSGHLIKGSVQKRHFSEHRLQTSLDYEIPSKEVYRLTKENYKNEIINDIKKSSNLPFDFCAFDLEYGIDPIIVYIQHDGVDDANLMRVMVCLHTWSLFPVGGWNNIWQFTHHGHRLTVMGVPSSSLSYLMPKDYKPIVQPIPEEKKAGTAPKTEM